MERLQDYGNELIVVIDPGHGGENQGTIENGHEEKLMTMITANAMYDELSQYEGIKVYLTRTEDVDLSLKERAVYAGKQNADFLISIHYNASANHTFFGSECWVPLSSPYNQYGYQLGNEFLQSCKDAGLFIRGIKTKINDKGNADYYGILRESLKLEVPSIIFEHCHVDEERDELYCDTEEDLIQFGKNDATVVAKYFGLKSSSLGVDYTNYDLIDVSENSPVAITLKDETAPEYCKLELVSADYDDYQMTFRVTAKDNESPLMYYRYSTDGGETISVRYEWPGSDTVRGAYDEAFETTLNVIPGSTPNIKFYCYNMFDLVTESEVYISEKTFEIKEESIEAISSEASVDVIALVETDISSSSNNDFNTFLEIGLIVVVLFVLLIAIILKAIKGRKNQDYVVYNDYDDSSDDFTESEEDEINDTNDE